LKLEKREFNLEKWEVLVKNIENSNEIINIAMV
jgi:hypothetical protein